MIISKNSTPRGQLYVNQPPIQVNNHIYLGAILSEHWDDSKEVKQHIEKACNMSKIFKSQ